MSGTGHFVTCYPSESAGSDAQTGLHFLGLRTFKTLLSPTTNQTLFGSHDALTK
jgi:hypothetical protein